MSEYLQEARSNLVNLYSSRPHEEKTWVRLTLTSIIDHLVELESQQTSATPATDQPVQNLSGGIGLPVETRPTWITSWERSCLVSRDGILAPSVVQAMSGWLNSRVILGTRQVLLRVEVTEIPIGSTPTSRDTAPPFGSPSPSTREPILEGNGPAGEWRAFRSSLVGPYVCRVTTEDTPSTPCFYMVNEESARDLKQLLNRAVLSDLPLEVS